MPKATRVHSTPPTNTSLSRRAVIVASATLLPAALPIAAAAAPATAQGLDAELIELGARLELLVDQYYVARSLGRVRLRQPMPNASVILAMTRSASTSRKLRRHFRIAASI
jgi:hypothetical protein